jgi:hypothetical protein
MIKSHVLGYWHWQTAARVHTPRALPALAVVAPALQLALALPGHEMLHPRQAPATGTSQ